MPLDRSISFAVPDWKQRIARGESLLPDLPLNKAVADRAEEIFCNLRIPDMPGTPKNGEVTEDWVIEIVRAIFGAYDPDARQRLFQDAFILICKKNTKSHIAACIILTAIIMNDRPLAEAILVAPSHKIAKISFKQIKGMIGLDQRLADRFHVQDHEKKITHLGTEATIEIVSADGAVVTGTKATFVLIDETHELARNSRAEEIMTELRGGMSSRPEGFMLQITTQSKKEPVGLFEAELRLARMVRDGQANLKRLVVLYEFPEDMQKSGKWKDPATWHMVNPNLGISVAQSFLQEQYLAAVEGGDEKMALFASQHLNVQVGLGLRNDSWVGTMYWPERGDARWGLDRIISDCEVCTVGIDGGGLDDLLGFAVIGREKVSRKWRMWNMAWAYPSVYKRHPQMVAELDTLEKQGDLVKCTPDRPDQGIDEMVAICLRLFDAGLLPEGGGIGMDNASGVGSIIDALELAGIPTDILKSVSQGYLLTGTIKTTEHKLFDGSLWHADQRLMRWSVGNAKCEAKGNAVVVTKAASGASKIDPLMATFNAVQLMSFNPVAANAAITIPSNYRVA